MKENQLKQKRYYKKRIQLREKVFQIRDSILWLKNNFWEVVVVAGKAKFALFGVFNTPSWSYIIVQN